MFTRFNLFQLNFLALCKSWVGGMTVCYHNSVAGKLSCKCFCEVRCFKPANTYRVYPSKANELLSEAKGLSSEQLDHLIAIAKGLKK